MVHNLLATTLKPIFVPLVFIINSLVHILPPKTVAQKENTVM